jgi:ribosome-associated protein
MTPDLPTEKTEKIAEAALDRKAENLVALDMRTVTPFADVFLIATGNSNRHVRSIADAIQQAMLALGEKPLGVEGYQDGRWVLLDLGDVIVHIFQAEVREHYDLERLWSEAQPIPIAGVEPQSVSR